VFRISAIATAPYQNTPSLVLLLEVTQKRRTQKRLNPETESQFSYTLQLMRIRHNPHTCISQLHESLWASSLRRFWMSLPVEQAIHRCTGCKHD
jgi:hypothetical protein